VGESLFNRGGVAQARYCTPIIHHHPKKNTLRGMGGGKEVFVESPKHGTARHLSPPYPPTHVREKSTLPKHGTARPLTPPTNPPFVEWGGGQGVFTVARLPRTALQVAYPPPEKPTIRGEQGGFTVALPKNGTASCLSPPRKTHHSCNGGVCPKRVGCFGSSTRFR
jgi:hypothetical protein